MFLVGYQVNVDKKRKKYLKTYQQIFLNLEKNNTMESFKAYFKIRFYKEYVRQREAVAKNLERDGYVNTADFLKVLADENLLDTSHDSRLIFDKSKIADIDPQTFAIYEYPSISYTLESERFEVINIGKYLTILHNDNLITKIEFYKHLYKVVNEE